MPAATEHYTFTIFVAHKLLQFRIEFLGSPRPRVPIATSDNAFPTPESSRYVRIGPFVKSRGASPVIRRASHSTGANIAPTASSEAKIKFIREAKVFDNIYKLPR